MKGKSCRSIVLMLAAVLVVPAGAYAVVNTIIITPDNEAAMGWTHYVTTFSHAPTQYPAAGGFSVAPVGTVDVPGVGHGAFWGNTGNTQITDPPGQGMDDVGGQVYFGTNNYSEVKLADIKKLYYRSYAADYITFNSTHYTRTPWRLGLAISKNSSGTDPIRFIEYRGWDGVMDDPAHSGFQLATSVYSGEFPYADHCMTWKGQDAYTGAGPTFQGVWVNFQLTDGSTTNYPWCGDWAHVVSKYSGGKILAGTGYWPDSWGIHDGTKRNPTNTCLTFSIGSPGNEPPSAYAGSIKQDINDNLNLCAWLDYFVIGYNKNSDPNQYTEDWIYFRPGGQGYNQTPVWTPGTVAMSTKSAYDKSLLDGPRGWKGNYIVLYGKVLASPAPTNRMFVIDDGSGKNVRVKITGNLDYGPYVDDIVRVKGVLHRYGWATTTPDIFVDGPDYETLWWP